MNRDYEIKYNEIDKILKLVFDCITEYEYTDWAVFQYTIEDLYTNTIYYVLDSLEIPKEIICNKFDINIDDSEYDTVSLTLQGLKTELDAISAGSLEGTVDIDEILESNGLTELTEGTYTAQVEWNLPEGVKEKAPVSVYVKVEKNN